MNQTLAIKKFFDLNKKIKELGYNINKRQILTNMEFNPYDIKCEKQIEWFVNTPNETIINDMIEFGDL